MEYCERVILLFPPQCITSLIWVHHVFGNKINSNKIFLLLLRSYKICTFSPFTIICELKKVREVSYIVHEMKERRS